jgi:hypothetical protein
MSTEIRTHDPTIRIPKRHLPWFTQMLMVFAVLVLAAVVYGFWSMAAAPMPKLDVPAQDAPAQGEPSPKPAPAAAPATPEP